MKGPIDTLEEFGTTVGELTPEAMAVEREAPPQPTRPIFPGGKALARLHLFEIQRDVEVSDVESGAPDKPLAMRLREPTLAREEAHATSPYLEAFEQKQLAAQAEPVMQIQPAWRPLGPFSIPHGQTYGSGSGSRPSVCGRVSAIAVDPSSPFHILLGAAGGGVWETRDGGATWAARTDNQRSLATGAIAFTPSNPSIVYAGTGEGNFYASLGTGLLRSLDGGRTWALRAGAPFVGIGFYDLIVDPLNPNHLLAGTTSSLAESNDGGATWTTRRAQRCWDLSMHPLVAGDPNSTKEVFAACGDGLFRSKDGGTTYSPVALPGAPAAFNRIAVAHAPSNGDIVYVFAAGGGGAFIWRRSAANGAFAAVTPPTGLSIGQAWYDWYAAVAPNNPDVLYVGAIDVHKGIRSPANVWTWTDISSKASGSSIHPDQHAIAFSPTDPNTVYCGSDGGIFRSTDAGTTWTSINKGLCITEFEYLAQHPTADTWLIGGTQDNGTMRYEGCEVWPHVADGDGGDCAINGAAPYTCYHTYYGMGMERSTSGGGWASYSWIGPNVPAGYGSLFYPPVEANGNVVAQAGQSVFISRNSGTTWDPAVALPAGAGVASALAIPTGTRVYVGTTSGNVYRIDLSGGVWQAPVALTTPRAGYVSDLMVDPTNPNRIWATYSNISGGHVFRSDNGGTNWTDVSAGLPTIPANAIVVDPVNTDRVYIGTDSGVFRSLNAGGAWTSYNNGLPNVLVGDLVFHPAARLLRAGTRSRGVWEIAVDQVTMPDVELYLRDDTVDTARRIPSPSGVADPFVPGSTTYWWQCTDIKIDSRPFVRPFIDNVDFEVFQDARGVFAAGLGEETATPPSRVYVQLHNRGPVAASNVAVKVFYADGAALPALPPGFWTNFPNNVLPASSPWHPIAPHKLVASIANERPTVVGFDWSVPSNTSGTVWLLAITTSLNDPIGTTQTNVASLVTSSKKAGLKRFGVLPYSRVQYTGTVQPNQTVRCFTFNWPANWYVKWTVMPVTPKPGAPELKYRVRVERASPTAITYWIDVTNETSIPVTFELRYTVLAVM